MNILVTGGTGYIGSHTAVELSKAGFHPVIADNLSNSRREVTRALQEITGTPTDFHLVDLNDYAAIRTLFLTTPIDAVIHFAAFKAVGESVSEPMKYYRNNIGSMINLLDAMKDAGVYRLVFSSSCTVYGESPELPVREDQRLGTAASPYGTTKQIGEMLLKDVCRSSGFNGISLRYFNPAGAHESALIGEFPLSRPANLVPVITRAAMRQEPVTVFGNDYDTPDGTCIRDYIHVTDVAEAHVAAVRHLLGSKDKTGSYSVLNIGSGSGHSVLEVVRSFENATGIKLDLVMGKRRPGDLAKIWADTSLAEKTLGWKSNQPLETIIRSAWEWEMKLKMITAD
ncbi:MAG: UDP-glucose 4-epimerase GalE [Bacteroidota bacterium]|jgi:UDP-glucose 4-epimerase